MEDLCACFVNWATLTNGQSKPFCILKHIFLTSICRFELDPTWSETGDRYLLKLFRDYVFHQVSESGEPVVDLSHVISNLNKVRQVSEILASSNSTNRLCLA